MDTRLYHELYAAVDRAIRKRPGQIVDQATIRIRNEIKAALAGETVTVTGHDGNAPAEIPAALVPDFNPESYHIGDDPIDGVEPEPKPKPKRKPRKKKG